MSRMRIALVGAGYLGQIHARLLSQMPDVELAAVVDPSGEARERIAQRHGVHVLAEVDELPPDIQAAVVAAPTHLHCDVGLRLLDRGFHVLMEKPLAATAEQGQRLLRRAESLGLVLQVGHVEQFNPAVEQLREQLANCRYLSVRRCGPYSSRSTDVSVVLDLMIHDLELLLSMMPAPLVACSSWGTTLVGPHCDLAQAQLQFANGCRADVLACRVDGAAERVWQAAGIGWYARLDLAARRAHLTHDRLSSPKVVGIHGSGDAERPSIGSAAPHASHTFDAPQDCNPLMAELTNFVRSIRGAERPRVPGHQALAALQLAERIEAQVTAAQNDVRSLRRAG